MTNSKISIAEIVRNFDEDVGKYPDILDALYKHSMILSDQIKRSLQSQEDLKTAYNDSPESTTILLADPSTKKYSKEILAWSIAILTSAWTEWIFHSKSNEDSLYQNDPKYKNDPERQAAVVNVRIALPYIRNFILDAMNRAKEIGTCKDTDYKPNPQKDPAYVQLRK